MTSFMCVGISMYVCGFSVPQMRQFCLFTYIPAKIKMSFIWKDDFFFLPKSASSVSRSQATFPALFKRIHNMNMDSFGGRIRLICQIRYELSVTINEISTGWKKTLDGGPNICWWIVSVYWKVCPLFFGLTTGKFCAKRNNICEKRKN